MVLAEMGRDGSRQVEISRVPEWLWLELSQAISTALGSYLDLARPGAECRVPGAGAEPSFVRSTAEGEDTEMG